MSVDSEIFIVVRFKVEIHFQYCRSRCSQSFPRIRASSRAYLVALPQNINYDASRYECVRIGHNKLLSFAFNANKIATSKR